MSADPARLEAFRRGSDDAADEVLRRVWPLEDALARLSVSGSVGLPSWGGVVEAVRANAVAHRRLAGWVEQVATAFRRADCGAIPALHGRADPAADRLVSAMAAVAAALTADDNDAVARLVGAFLSHNAPSDHVSVAALATQFSGEKLDQLARSHPELVGGIEGWPEAARYGANRVLIERALATSTGGRRKAFESFLADDPATGRTRQFLNFDPSGGGRVVEVFGSIASAGSVALFVPGMSSDLDHFDGRIAARARNLWTAASDREPPRPVAVIAWLGYDAPDDLPSLDAASPDQAKEGGRDLARFVSGLDLRADQEVTLVAHSYGTTVVGAALRDGARADRVLAMGSPGMLVGKASDFKRGEATKLYTMEAPADLVTDLERFGDDPNERDSGFVRLETGGRGHSSYLEADSISLANAAALVVGDRATLVERSPSPIEQIPPSLLPPSPAESLDPLIDKLQDRFDPCGDHPRLDRLIDTSQAINDNLTLSVRRPAERVEDALDTLSDLRRAVFG